MRPNRQEPILFSTSVVGSVPRPQFVRDLIASSGTLAPEEYVARMDAAVRYVVAMQEHAGLDVVTDGEWRRKSYIGVIADLAHGFELSTNPADGRPLTVVVDKLAAKEPGFIAREVAFLKSVASRRVKATLPAPALLGERMWDPELSSAAYPTREQFVRDCVPILRREVALVREAGADVVQIDDPHLCLFVDQDVRAGYEDPDAAADFSVDMVNQVLSGHDIVPSAIGEATTAVHLCRRAGARARGEHTHQGGYGPIIGQLNRLRTQHLTLEFTAPEAGDMQVLRELREDFQIGLGCVSVTPGQVDTAAEIVERVEAAMQYLDPERITLNPDCGFAPGSGANVSIDEVYAKLTAEVAAALILRERVGSGATTGREHV
jgi:5-methyltetrahydropteroyltriglutamate--homocysteine methyltransferase